MNQLLTGLLSIGQMGYERQAEGRYHLGILSVRTTRTLETRGMEVEGHQKPRRALLDMYILHLSISEFEALK
jgi:hypothetical protein